MKYDYDIMVIGSGSAGLTVSIGAAWFGLKVLVVERHKIGGDCLNYGCVPSKSLIKSAYAAYTASQAAHYGVVLPQGPHDTSGVMKYVKGVISSIAKEESVSALADKGVEVVLGDPEFVDAHTVAIDDKKYSARKIVLATGSSPRRIPIEGSEEVGYITNEELFGLDTLPDSLVMMGAGPIGVELAQALNRLGTKVTIVTMGPQILERESKEISDRLASVLQSEGVQIVTGASVKKLEKQGGLKRLVYEREGQVLHVDAAEIMLAIGRVPNSKIQGLETTDVVLTERGHIQVDKTMRTNVPHIYACGDVTGGFQFTHTAAQEGAVVLTNMIKPIMKSKVSYEAVPWVTFTDPELAHVGHTEKSATDEGIAYQVYSYEMKHLDRVKTDSDPNGLVRVLVSDGRIVGADILARHASGIMHELALAVSQKTKIKDIAWLTHAYPTHNEAVQKVAKEVTRAGADKPWIKKLMRILFRNF